jgi:cysteate synthase
MYDAWRHESREMLAYDVKKARRDAELIDAKVLSNRKPPYGIAGGLYDALKATDGDIVVATNAQARRACKLFQELEAIDIHPAAGVTLASLIKMVESNAIDKDACIMLNITGAGEEAAKKNKELWYLKPSKVFSLTASVDEVTTYVETLFN